MRFALISNTAGESPYSGPGAKVSPAIKEINAHNPVFLVHLGGMICGGTRWDGISNIDINRQFNEIFSAMKELKPIFYIVRDDSDIFSQSPDYYLEYSKREDNYSFNYGNLHFLVLNSSNSSNLKPEEKEWIKTDLNQIRSFQDTFVFIYHPLFLPEKNKSQETELRCKNYEELHQYFIKYRIKAVFSGISSIYFKTEVDGITYINAGCGEFNKNEIARTSYQYYLVDYINGELKIQPKNVE